ncbi:uncharacterized protein BX664DRAFT_254822 [Halteromyces radiatus]|uniref:uncharacterized protein n=1 Tax=Halteromyces radiatus TaxID=101107 RepID=UPI00221FD77A|nr:uncharacterized protein BX664DRAFT_254822 [Halteromyces radiatus]KAI8099023.1 hypothetical protein BX664DRAFT_254822 [Halteromyces radiatus]
MVAFVKWYVSSLNASYSSRVPKGEWEKKPYNPVLGEQYFMKWGQVDDCGETNVVCEQVSHHPPITGFCIKNEKAGLTLNGHTGQKTRFSTTSLICDQVGQSIVELASEESYLLTSPSLTVNGIWYAAPYVELTGNSYIQATTGLYATFEFSSKGWISGERNHFKCYIRKNGGNSKEYLYKIEGQWSYKSTITPYGSKKSEPFLDVTQLTPAPMEVKPLDQQGEMESRKIWQHVSEAIQAGDTTKAGVEKSKIENQKRAELAEREENKTTWEPIYFKWQDPEPKVQSLQRMLSSAVKNKYDPVTSGNWVFHPSQ